MIDDGHHPPGSPWIGGDSATPASKRRWLGSSLVVLFLVASLLRLGHLEESRIVAERQFESAIIAREYAIRDSPSVPEWRKRVATASSRGIQLREPRITEWLVSVAYRLIGDQPLWVAGLLCSLFWLMGGFVLYRIARRVGSAHSALLTTAYFLLVPLGVIVSISFLPDSLMIMLLLLAVLAILRHHERSSWSTLVIAALASGAAVLAKPFCAITLAAVYIALALSRERSARCLLRADFFLISSLVIAIGAGYYLHGMFIADRLMVNLRTGFLPSLLMTREFWRDWWVTGSGAVGPYALILAVPGLALLRGGPGLPLLIGLTVGYALFGIAYTVPFPKAGYYHLQLMIIVALGLGAVGAWIVDRLRATTRMWWLIGLVCLVSILFSSERQVVRRLSLAKEFESARVAHDIGEIVGHSTRTLFLAPYYGRPLEYFAELSGEYWLRGRVSLDWINYRLRGDAQRTWDLPDWLLRRPGFGEVSLEERFQALDFSPQYFVITAFDEFELHHSDLAELLCGNCPLVAEDVEYLIFDLSKCLEARVPSP